MPQVVITRLNADDVSMILGETLPHGCSAVNTVVGRFHPVLDLLIHPRRDGHLSSQQSLPEPIVEGPSDKTCVHEEHGVGKRGVSHGCCDMLGGGRYADARVEAPTHPSNVRPSRWDLVGRCRLCDLPYRAVLDKMRPRY